MGEERSGHAVTPEHRVLAAHQCSYMRPRPSAPQHRWPQGDQVTNVRQDTALPQLMEIDLHVTPD